MCKLPAGFMNILKIDWKYCQYMTGKWYLCIGYKEMRILFLLDYTLNFKLLQNDH